MLDCITQLEASSLGHENFYIGDIPAKTRLLKQQYCLGLSPKLGDDPVVVAALLKEYLRELPAPLITADVSRKLAATLDKEGAARNALVREVLTTLPPSHQATLKALVYHLIHVSERSAENRMSLRVLATVFGPLAIRDAAQQSHPVDNFEVILQHYSSLPA